MAGRPTAPIRARKGAGRYRRRPCPAPRRLHRVPAAHGGGGLCLQAPGPLPLLPRAGAGKVYPAAGKISGGRLHRGRHTGAYRGQARCLSFQPVESPTAGTGPQGESADRHSGEIAGGQGGRLHPMGQGVQLKTDGANPLLFGGKRAAGIRRAGRKSGGGDGPV